MIKIKYDSWDQISIGLYKEIKKICLREDLEPVDKNIALIALLSDTPEEDCWNLNFMTEIPPLFKAISWIWEFDFSKNWKAKKLKLKGNSYEVCVDLQKFSVAQYVDFQTLFPKIQESDDDYSRVLATILIPEGKKYCKDYDLEEVIADLEENLPITTANSIFYFFLTSLLSSLRATELAYTVMMKLKRMRIRSKDQKEKIKELEEKVKHLIRQAQLIICSL